MKMSKTPWVTGLSAPMLGEHTEQVLKGLSGLEGEDVGALARGGSGDVVREASEPLEGFVVVDMSEVWAGPMAASMLGDLGATVIKLESFPRPSLTRSDGAGYRL